VPIVRCHHENWDGTGYPRGVVGEDIPIGARILSVVDCFDALTSDRPYRRALTDQAAIDILLERRGRMYDPHVVDTFIAIYKTIDLPTKGEPHQALDEISRARQTRVAPPSPVQPSAVSPYAGDELLAFVSLARLASGSGSLGDLLALSTRLVRQLTPEASGAWFILSEDADRLVALEAFGPAADGLEGLTIRTGERLTGWVAANRQPIVNSDAALDVGDRATTFGVSLRSCLSVPLMDGAKLAGVLTLYAQDRDAFSEDLGRLIQMVAPHIAQAILARRGEDAEIEIRELKLVSSR
jgi:GAF domain-containing protein